MQPRGWNRDLVLRLAKIVAMPMTMTYGTFAQLWYTRRYYAG